MNPDQVDQVFFAYMSSRDQDPVSCDADSLGAFEARWLAEVVRLREEAHGSPVDTAAVRAAVDRAQGVEACILARACQLGVHDGTLSALRAWRARTRVVMWLLLGFALISGFGAALAVLGDGSRPVNVVWALGGLLGVNLFSLVLWFGGLWLGGADAGGVFGRGWLWISRRFSSRGDSGVHVPRALVGLMGRAGLTRWWLGAVTHGLWLLALCGALAGLLIALSVRSYGFVWETTILPADAFTTFVGRLGWLPALAGFGIPDAETVRASGSAVITHEAGRLAWSSWLTGCLVVYGVVPRALLWAGCLTYVRLGRNRLRLDLALPAYAALAARYAPTSDRIGITDAAPGALPSARIRMPHRVGSHAAAIVGLELRSGLGWPPALAPEIEQIGVLDSREQRRQAIARLEASPPARLLIACDARLSPDRGSLELIAELSRHAGDCRVWLIVPATLRERDRVIHWRDALVGAGFGSRAIFDDATAAIAWLECGGDAA